MTTDTEYGELTADNLKDWANDNSGSVAELNWNYKGDKKTPWGVYTPVAGSDYSYGDGHEMGFVVEVAGRYFHASGTYTSWDGSEYDNFVEVEPVEVTVRRYRTLDSKVAFDDPVINV